MLTKYKTFSNRSTGEFKDKGSKFIGYAFPAENEGDCKILIEQVRKEHPKSRHICYAFRVGIQYPVERSNDDGEPSGTAGKPILRQIHSNELHNVIIIVVRYFGGTLLGVANLISAYKSAAANAIAENKIINKEVNAMYRLSFDYSCYHKLMNFLKKEHVGFVEQKMDAGCTVIIGIKTGKAKEFEKNLGNFKNIEFSFIKYE